MATQTSYAVVVTLLNRGLILLDCGGEKIWLHLQMQYSAILESLFESISSDCDDTSKHRLEYEGF